MPLNDWEFSYGGLVFGGATTYGVLQVTGLGPPDSKEDVKQKVTTHGAFVFANYYGERRIIIDGDIVGAPTTLQGLVDTWRAAFAPVATPTLLNEKKPTTAERSYKCICTRRKLMVDFLFGLGIARWTVELVAGDPAIYNSAGTVKLFDG